MINAGTTLGGWLAGGAMACASNSACAAAAAAGSNNLRRVVLVARHPEVSELILFNEEWAS